ncbi:MAG TPA: DUF5008 domain-containing protein [Pedobacter sp.]|uniref:DUF5008 domain-containing protein n=1 Tax=Pedobacter sp. TaxID=1411316 RepID=UPI002C77D98E|nr:DUF5008 domain-containing protein [Pedobacter sp.]HMI02807.1 DUF5008 domain-containing protein [Pedobacter sp.]
MKLKHTSILLLCLATAFISACEKSKVYEDPYKKGKEPLGVKVNLAVPPTPQEGEGGTVTTFAATGLIPYEDQIVFSFNGQEAEIIAVTENGISVKVPETASSGATTLTIGDQVFFGPKFKVIGKISIDPEFRVKGGADKGVNYALAVSDERFILVGSFTDYDGRGLISPVNRIVRTFSDGSADVTFRSGGADGTLNSIVPLNDKFITGGSFSSFFHERSALTNINNITRLSSNGEVDSVGVDTYSTTHSIAPGIPATGKKKYVPVFNGGTNSTIDEVFNFQNKIIAVGNFRYYVKHRYDVPRKPVTIGSITITSDSLVVDSTEAPQVIRLDDKGSLDQTYRTGLAGGNGTISNSFMQADGKLVVVGNFNNFDGIAAGRIVRLKSDGTVDATFNSGLGADRSIYTITYNAISNKYLISGSFTSYNGTPAAGVALLNADGSLDNSFSSKGFSSEGIPVFAKQLSNGLIIVNGSFTGYNGIRRASFMVLTPAGELAKGYNAIGELKGSLSDLYETTTSNGKIAVMLLGAFTEIDGTPVSNITRLVFEN